MNGKSSVCGWFVFTQGSREMAQFTLPSHPTEQNVSFLVLSRQQTNPQTETSRLVFHLAALGQNMKETQMPGLGNH